MLFNSFTFLIFFTLNVIIYYLLPHKMRWIFLLVCSYIFYMFWKPVLIILIVFSTLVNFVAAKMIYDDIYKKTTLTVCMAINFGLLFIFKYLTFINTSIASAFGFLGLNYPIPAFDIILPMGISFYTFQAASYTIDVYRDIYKPEKNFFRFSLFISFFPQLVAGPIERTDRLLPQLFTRKRFKADNLIQGSKYILTGFYKKIVIADRLAPYVNTIYKAPQEYGAINLAIATVMFAFQIYCDFSGYSDIAVGCARILGIELCQNFNSPYFAKGIKDFWRRWHISLSGWFRDYCYIPLGGNRKGFLRSQLNILTTFLASGLWHGANWTFVIWGGLHGLFQVIENCFSYLFKKPVDFLKPLYLVFTFLLVCLAWIFFRSETVSDAFLIVGKILTLDGGLSASAFFNAFSVFKTGLAEVILISLCVVYLLVFEIFRFKGIFFYLSLLLIILSLGVYGSAGAFIYFQF